MYNDVQVRIAIAGAGGRMGKQLIKVASGIKCITIGAALEHKSSLLLGRDAGELANIGKIGVPIQSSLNRIKGNFDIFIDFTYPDATLNHLNFCYQHNKAMVIGTTGFDNIGKQKINKFSNGIAIVLASNFSIGINIILKLLEKTAKVVGHYSDIDIIDAHHRYKVDTPSGTALVIGETIASALGKDLKDCAINKHDSKRSPGTVKFTAIRAGDIIGEHTVMFTDIGERIEITHRASSRAIFANGALRSAIWLRGKKNGLFDMKDVLELTKF